MTSASDNPVVVSTDDLSRAIVRMRTSTSEFWTDFMNSYALIDGNEPENAPSMQCALDVLTAIHIATRYTEENIPNKRLIKSVNGFSYYEGEQYRVVQGSDTPGRWGYEADITAFASHNETPVIVFVPLDTTLQIKYFSHLFDVRWQSIFEKWLTQIGVDDINGETIEEQDVLSRLYDIRDVDSVKHFYRLEKPPVCLYLNPSTDHYYILYLTVRSTDGEAVVVHDTPFSVANE